MHSQRFAVAITAHAGPLHGFLQAFMAEVSEMRDQGEEIPLWLDCLEEHAIALADSIRKAAEGRANG